MTTTLYITEENAQRNMTLADHEKVTIGRDRNNDVIINNPAVSRSHAMIHRIGDGRYTLTDLGSANGTFVNDRKVSIPTLLSDGDLIKLGNAEIKFSNPMGINDGPVTGREDSTINVVQDVLTTVFVADLRGFTKLSEILTPRVLTDIINAWCKRAQGVIDRYGGHVDKFIGDAVMASWSHNNEVNPTEDIQSALWAAVDLNKETKELSDKFNIELPFPLKMGVGINTGSVTVGNVGQDARRDFTMLGDTVNMAFRYETQTKIHGTDINIGDLTMKWLKGTGTAFRKIEIELPGRSSTEIMHGISMQELELHLMKTMTVF